MTTPFPGTDVYNDDDQASLSYEIDGTTANAVSHPDVVTNDGAGSFVLHPGANTLQSLAEDEVLVLTYPWSATDNHGVTDNGTITITVTGVNDPPMAEDDAASVIEDAPTVIDVLANDDDVDSDDDRTTLIVTGASATSGAEVSF